MSDLHFTMQGYREERGLIWPAYDQECARAVFNTLADMRKAVDLCKARNVVVQAGGNCGVWAIELAKLFGDVYTFEPDPVNFTALSANTAPYSNIVKMQAALGEKPQLVGVTYDEKANCGCGRVNFKGNVPTLRIDDLGLPQCDLLCLDVEGRELSALKGATATIRSKRPVILIEDKGLSSHYGIQKGVAPAWLVETFGYEVHSTPGRDVILIPRD